MRNQSECVLRTKYGVHAEKNCPRTFLSMGEHQHWNLEDPAAAQGTEADRLAKFVEIRDEIDRRRVRRR